MNRVTLRFTLINGGGTILGDDHDTDESLLAVLLDKWPD